MNSNPDAFPAPQPESQIEIDPANEAALSDIPVLYEVAPTTQPTDAVQVSPFSIHSTQPIAAPEIGESQELLITDVVASIQTAKTAKSQTAKAAEINLRFWVTVVGLGFVLLVAVSDWRSKDGPPIPFPSTSKIPQVR